jgi:hypothetical protein
MKEHDRLLADIPTDALVALENELYEPRFMGEPIGATLNDFLVTQFFTGALPLGLPSTLRALLGWCRFYWFGPRKRKPFPNLEPGRFLFTWLADTPRLNDLVLPVIAEFNPTEYNVIGGAESIGRKLPVGTGFCIDAQAFSPDLRAWRHEYRNCRSFWHQTVRRWLKRNGLPRRALAPIGYALAVRSLCIAGAFDFLDKIRPRVIVSDSEHSAPWSSLILAARQMGIPTIQMMHGVICPSFSYTPLLSDIALCWGEQQREQMIERGTKPERLLLTGCQRLHREISADPQHVRARLRLPLEGTVITLATNPMPRSDWRKLVFTFAEAFQSQRHLIPVVRLHASEKAAHYAEEIAQCPGLRFLENSLWTVEEAMAVSEVFVIYNSGLGNDALVFRRLVVLLNVISEPLSEGWTLAEKAGCPIAKTSEELRNVIHRILQDEEYRRKLGAQSEEFVKWFCVAFGKDAARNVASEIRRHIELKNMGKPTISTVTKFRETNV